MSCDCFTLQRYKKNPTFANISAKTWDFFSHYRLKSHFLRRVVGFNRLRLDHAARVAFLPVLAFRRHRARHVAARKGNHQPRG